MVVGRVGGVARHRDGAGGEDAELGHQPFRPVLGDQHDPVAGMDAERAQRAGEPQHVVARLRPGDGGPAAVIVARMQEGVARIGFRLRQEHGHERFLPAEVDAPAVGTGGTHGFPFRDVVRSL